MAVKIFLVFLAVIWGKVSGHGYMITPPNRASLWRVYSGVPANYGDNQYFCGGTYVQYDLNGGRCGICGDNYADPQPRSNENTGTYGLGIITGTYAAGSVIEVSSTLTANHLGTISYSVCALGDSARPETEDCFQDLKLADGSAAFTVKSTDKAVVNSVKLPAGLTCDHCVLRWHYRTANSWGVCEDGTGAVGCGNQEVFRSCADIAIV